MFDIVPPGPADLEGAVRLFVAFGKNGGHPMALNFGDLFSYALAKGRNLPRLFKGAGFSEADVQPAVPGLA
jgi:ribonuclease VapC